MSTDRTTPTYFGLDQESLKGRALAELNPAFTDRYGPLLRNILDGASVPELLEIETPLPSRPGEVAYFRASFFPIRLPDGRKCLGTVGIEITDLRRAEEKVRESEARFRALIENASDAFFLHDEAGRFVDVNRQACESLGYTREELLTMGVTEVEQDMDLAAAQRLWSRISPEMPVTAIGHHRRKDGSVFPVEARIGSCMIQGQRLYLALIRDITARERAEEQLRLSNDDLQAYAYTVSHDLQEPLRMVTAYVDLLAQRHGRSLDAEARGYMDVVRAGALRMSAMLQDLLKYSRAGDDASRPIPVDAGEAVRRALDALERKLADTGARADVAPLPVVRAYEGRLEQVFQNLIENSLKYRRPDTPPEIRIDAVPAGRMCQFSVTDNGVGMDMKYVERIFRVFQRLEKRTGESGNGIGLSIARRIVERHGGRIWVDWSEPGRGTRFCFTLPSADGGARQ